MKVQSSLITSGVLVLGMACGSVSADYLFSFSGTITTDNGSTGLQGSSFTLNMFVQDLAVDQTAGGNAGTFAISQVQIDIGSDGSIEESFSPNLSNQAVYIDAGATQLVGAFDLGGSFASFLIGVNVPTNAFADPHSLSGQSNFTLSGLLSSSYSFYHSDDLSFVLDLTSFTFENNVNVVPLPPAGIAGLGMLGVFGIYRSRRS